MARSGQPIMTDSMQESGKPTGEHALPLAEDVNFQLSVYQLFEESVRRYTGGGSRSVPESVAARMMESLLFVVGEGEGILTTGDGLPGDALQRQFDRRCDELNACARGCEPLWGQICVAMPQLDNVALRDTLASIEGFWDCYDPRLFAQETTCDIDYPLALPVDESLLGPVYVEEYLRRLLVEARFLARFENTDCTRVLEASCPDWRGLLVNLYESVAARALGCIMVGRDPSSLHLVPGDGELLSERWATMKSVEVEKTLDASARELAGQLSFDEFERGYAIAYARTLVPRLVAGGAPGVFTLPCARESGLR